MDTKTVCVIYQSPNVGKSVIDDLAATLGGHVRIIGQMLAELEQGPADADYFIVPSQRAAEIVKRARPDIRTVVSRFTLNVHELPRLLRLRSGTNCLVVAAAPGRPRRTPSGFFRGSGSAGSIWSPTGPGDFRCLYVETAITLGSSNLCPAGISSIVDLGPEETRTSSR